jgi:hypothetical protein
MADNNFKGGPGGRLKAEEAKNTLYVTNPNDRRLQMYQDSLSLYNTFAGNNPIEINKTFLESYNKDITRPPSRNYAPLTTGPYGSALSKVKKTATAPLNSNKLLGPGFTNAPAVYAGVVNSGSGTGDYSSVMGVSKSGVTDLIAEDESNKFHKRKRSFAPIGYQSVEHYSPSFVGDYWTTDASGTKLLERTPQLENRITPQQVRAIFPKITNQELNEIIKRGTSPQSGDYAILDKNGQLVRDSGRRYPNAVRSEGIEFSPQKDYITTPIYAKPKREVILVPPRKKSEPIEPISPRQAPVPTFAPEEIVAPVMRPVPIKEPVFTEEVAIQKPIARKPPKAVMPTRQGGWGNQPLLMKLFPKLYER